MLVYVDANVDLVGSLRPLANTFLASGTDLGLVPHPFRRCAYVEGAAVLLQERDEVENVRRSLAYLEHCQLPDDAGLYEMNLFMLRPGEAGGRFSIYGGSSFSGWGGGTNCSCRPSCRNSGWPLSA